MPNALLEAMAMDMPYVFIEIDRPAKSQLSLNMGRMTCFAQSAIRWLSRKW